MKIVQTPPKTGEEFIVAWFDDGEAKSRRLRYNLDDCHFEREFALSGFYPAGDKYMQALCKDSLIIIEG